MVVKMDVGSQTKEMVFMPCPRCGKNTDLRLPRDTMTKQSKASCLYCGLEIEFP